MPAVLDVGGGTNPDPRATQVADIRAAPATDVQFDATDRWPLTANSFDGVVFSHVLEHFDQDAIVHVFREAARVLRAAGWVEASVPLGVNAITDSDHETRWTYETPEQFSRPHRRAWDPELPFELVSRSLNVWLGGPAAPATPLLQAASQKWPAWAAERCYSGVLTARYRKLSDGSER